MKYFDRIVINITKKRKYYLTIFIFQLLLIGLDFYLIEKNITISNCISLLLCTFNTTFLLRLQKLNL